MGFNHSNAKKLVICLIFIIRTELVIFLIFYINLNIN